nr:MAG TPA: hypothetical protein [Caudoviricetes sp.]
MFLFLFNTLNIYQLPIIILYFYLLKVNLCVLIYPLAFLKIYYLLHPTRG